MRVFVTGGAGYVGSHCVKGLISAGHEVVVYDNLSCGHRGAVDHRAAFVEGDLAERAKLRELFCAGRFDAVVHFAASASVGESVQQPLRYYRNNVGNTLVLLETMQEAGIRRLVFSSTCAVYGVPEKLPLTEDMPLRPISPYGATKLTVEWMLGHSAQAWGLGAVALRYFNAAGAAADGTIGEDHSPECHLIPLVLQVSLGRSDTLQVYGADYATPDGSCVRDYVHVDDLAEAHALALERMTDGQFEALNVGTGSGHSVLEVIDAARRVTGHSIPVVIGGRRLGDPPTLYANAERIRGRLGWKPRHADLLSIIESAWRWHRTHPEGFFSR